jgi:hypothetical protein
LARPTRSIEDLIACMGMELAGGKPVARRHMEEFKRQVNALYSALLRGKEPF